MPNKSIFELGDMFGYSSPFGDWLQEEKDAREARETAKQRFSSKTSDLTAIGYNLSITDKSTYVVSINLLVCNLSSLNDAGVQSILAQAKKIYESMFSKITPTATYKAIFNYQIIKQNDKRFYSFGFSTDRGKLPEYYLMTLHDEEGGGTDTNPNNPLKSAHFRVGIRGSLKVRTIVHESLHPILKHIWTEDSANPLHHVYIAINNKINAFYSEGKIKEADTYSKSGQVVNFVKNIMNTGENPDGERKRELVKDDGVLMDDLQRKFIVDTIQQNQ